MLVGSKARFHQNFTHKEPHVSGLGRTREALSLLLGDLVLQTAAVEASVVRRRHDPQWVDGLTLQLLRPNKVPNNNASPLPRVTDKQRTVVPGQQCGIGILTGLILQREHRVPAAAIVCGQGENQWRTRTPVLGHRIVGEEQGAVAPLGHVDSAVIVGQRRWVCRRPGASTIV